MRALQNDARAATKLHAPRVPGYGEEGIATLSIAPNIQTTRWLSVQA